MAFKSKYVLYNLYDIEIPRDVVRIGFDGMVWAVSRVQIGVFMTVTVS